MFIFSILTRIIAFSMLWVITIIPLSMEPIFGINGFIFGFIYMYFGQSGASWFAVLWSVIIGIILGESQSSSGGIKQEIESNNFITNTYIYVYNLWFKQLEEKILMQNNLYNIMIEQ